jgi:hypothetical protein
MKEKRTKDIVLALVLVFVLTAGILCIRDNCSGCEKQTAATEEDQTQEHAQDVTTIQYPNGYEESGTKDGYQYHVKYGQSQDGSSYYYSWSAHSDGTSVEPEQMPVVEDGSRYKDQMPVVEQQEITDNMPNPASGN